MEVLKPCPFCGGEAHVVCVEGIVFVDCYKCHSSGQSFDKYDDFEDKDAIEAWNRRAK